MRPLALAALALLTLSTTSATAKPFDKLKEDLKESGWAPKKKEVDDGLAETDGVTSPLHQEHMGEILFSTQPIPEGGPSASQLVDSVTLGDDLYLQAYLPDSLYNSVVKDPELEPAVTMAAHLTVRAGGSECVALFRRDKEGRDWRRQGTSLTSPLVARDGGDLPRAFGRCVAELQSTLTPGEHELELELRARTTKPHVAETAALATGRLTVTVTADSFDPENRTLCPMPQAVHSDPAQERALRQRVGAQAREVRLLSRDWIVIHHELTGAILMRNYPAAVAIEEEGACSYATYDFTQQYTGSGYSDKMTVSTQTQGRGQVPCACLK